MASSATITRGRAANSASASFRSRPRAERRSDVGREIKTDIVPSQFGASSFLLRPHTRLRPPWSHGHRYTPEAKIIPPLTRNGMPRR